MSSGRDRTDFEPRLVGDEPVGERSPAGAHRPLRLVISPTPSGWQVIDAERRLPASWYMTVDEARREASDYLAMHGGGQLVVYGGKAVLSEIDVERAA